MEDKDHDVEESRERHLVQGIFSTLIEKVTDWNDKYADGVDLPHDDETHILSDSAEEENQLEENSNHVEESVTIQIGFS